MSDKEDDFRPSAMSLRALITPIVAVLLILSGVVLSVLLTGTGIQNEAEVVRSQKLLDAAFKTVGRDFGRVAVTLAHSSESYQHLVENFDRAWADEHLSAVKSGFGAVDVMVVSRDDSAIYQSWSTDDASITPTILGIVHDVRKLPVANLEWTSAFVIHGGRRKSVV